MANNGGDLNSILGISLLSLEVKELRLNTSASFYTFSFEGDEGLLPDAV